MLLSYSVLLDALHTGQAADIVLAIEGWLFILVIWAGLLWIARGTWRAYSETTAGFLALSIRRCRANLSAIPFAWYGRKQRAELECLLDLQRQLTD